jgi:hypothetical protein
MLVPALVRENSITLAGEETCRQELSKQLAAEVDGRRPLAGLTNCGKLQETKTAGSPSSGRGWIQIETSSWRIPRNEGC